MIQHSEINGGSEPSDLTVNIGSIRPELWI